MPRLKLPVVLTLCMLALASCDSAEERAEGHFQRGLELLQGGDITRAIVELRNVFQLNATHREARMLMARIEEDRNNAAGAYGQYRAVTESHPDDLEAQRAAARLAAELGQWDAASRHADAVEQLLPEGQADPVIQTVEIAAAYQQARRDQDAEAAQARARDAAELLREHPDFLVARRVVIDDLVTRQDWAATLAALDEGLEHHPMERAFYALRLAALERLGRIDEIEEQLRDMVQRFPDDANVRQTLVRWYVSQNRADDAESWLRTQIDPSASVPDAQMTLVAFLAQLRGPEAAAAELDRVLAETPEDDASRALYRSARASLDFDMGERDTAIAQMQDIIAGAEDSDQIRKIKVTLAKMLVRTGNPVGARALIEEVLTEDPSHVDALKMRATWMIEDDRPDDALIELRRALDQAPRDPETLTLMARAQERSGSRDLMGEMLALAVEASNSAPEESLRYAEFLVQDNRLRPAEDVLIAALRLQRGNVRILNALGNIYVREQDWGRTQSVIDALSGQSAPSATAIADELTARMLAGQNRQSELQGFLERLASGGENSQAIASAVRLRLENGDVAGTLDYLDGLLRDNPDDPQLRFLLAHVRAQNGETDEARRLMGELISETPDSERLYVALYNLEKSAGDAGAARAALDAGLAALPDSANLQWMRAGDLEQAGDIDGAIAIYEALYEKNSNSAIIANNLSSLISSYREDEESLRRAFAIARRLRGTGVPAFQDTYGWIAARLGNLDEALDHLEPAATALKDDPTVQYHLARTYAMANRDADALAAYREVARILQNTDRVLPFRDEVASEISRLESARPVDN